MARLEIGKIVNTHGLKGEVKVQPWCDDAVVFLSFKTLTTAAGELNIENARLHKNVVIIKFLGIDTIDEANKLRDEVLFVEKSQLGELPPDTYYVADIIGINVFKDDIRIGSVKDCYPTGSNDIYIIQGNDGAEHIIPAISQVVKKIDIAGRRMDIHPDSEV